MESRDHAFSERTALRDYAAVADANSRDGFPGASAIRVTPMATSTAAATRKPMRSLALWIPSLAITAPWAKLDQAAKAIRLRWADGFLTAISRKMPSGT